MKQNFKMLQKQMLEEAKRNGINLNTNDDVKKSPYKVAIAVQFIKNDAIYKSFEFVADYNRFGAHLDFCQSKFKENPLFVIGSHYQTIAISQKNDISFEFMCTSILNHICYYVEVDEAYKSLPTQSQGFIITLDAHDVRKTTVWNGTIEQLAEHINNSNNRLYKN